MDGPPTGISRRELIVTTAFVPLAALTASAQPAGGALSPDEMRTLEAFIARLIPADELGPGAVEAGVQIYIDRALASAYADRKASFTEGLRNVDSYARRAHGHAFADLAPADRDTVISAMEQGTADAFPTARGVFAAIRSLTMEGMFGDPHYGGNKDYAGWDLIRYPGPRLAVAPEDQALNRAAKPYRQSAWGAQHGH